MTEQNDNMQNLSQNQAQNENRQIFNISYLQNPVGFSEQNSLTEKQKYIISDNVDFFIFILLDVLLWLSVYKIGIIAGIFTLAAILLAVTGLKMFGKGQGKSAGITTFLIFAGVMFILEYLNLALDFRNETRGMYAAGEIKYALNYAESLVIAWQYLTLEKIIWLTLKKLIIFAAFCLYSRRNKVKQ